MSVMNGMALETKVPFWDPPPQELNLTGGQGRTSQSTTMTSEFIVRKYVFFLLVTHLTQQFSLHKSLFTSVDFFFSPSAKTKSAALRADRGGPPRGGSDPDFCDLGGPPGQGGPP